MKQPETKINKSGIEGQLWRDAHDRPSHILRLSQEQSDELIAYAAKKNKTISLVVAQALAAYI